MTAREFKNFPVTMTLAAWLMSAPVANKAKKRYNESTYNRANREEKEMKMASNFIKKITGTNFPKMEISSMFSDMVAVVELLQNLETPTKTSSTELFYGGRLYSCDKAML